VEEDALHDIDIVKITIKTKFEEEMWSNRVTDNKRKMT
jgi:hypothetical protein